MNTTFSFNRLGLLIKRYFIENKTKEIMYWGILILVFTLIHKDKDTPKIVLYVMGFIFAARQFKSFAYTPGGMHYLLIPATHLEKLVSTILLSTVYYFTMIMITYSIGNIVGTSLFNLLIGGSEPATWEFFNSTNTHFGANFEMLPGNAFIEMIINFLIIQSLFMLGSIYFKRNAIGRTMLSVFAFFIVIGIIESFFFRGFFGDISLMRNMNSFSFMAESSTTLTIIGNGFKIFSYLLIPFFWTVTYFRLTEKQV